MFKDFIKQQAGIEIYPLISLTVFAVFFILLLVMVFSYRKSFIAAVSMLPLDNEPGKGPDFEPAQNVQINE